MSLLAAAGISAAAGLLETGIGMYRFNQGKKEYEKLIKNLPKYEIPSEFQANQQLAKGEYQKGMPGADIARNMIYSSTEAGLSRAEQAATSSVDLMGATADFYAKELEGLNSLAFQQAQAKSQGLDRLMNANLAMASEKTKKWETNEWLPSQMKLNIASSKMASGESFMQKGIGDTFGSISSYLTESARINELGNIFNPKGSSTTETTTPSSQPMTTFGWKPEQLNIPSSLYNNFNRRNYFSTQIGQ